MAAVPPSAGDRPAHNAPQRVVKQQDIDSLLELEHRVLDLHAIVSVTDAAGRIIYVNDKFCEISGFERSELMGQNHRLLKSGLHQDDFYRDMWSTISSGRPWQGKVCNRAKDGSLYWVASTIAPVMDDSGRPYRYFSIRTDVTRLKLAELALAEHQQQWLFAQRLAHIGSWVFDLSSGAFKWSDEVCRIFGGDADAGVCRPSLAQLGEFIHPEDRARVQASQQAAIETDTLHDMVYRIVRPSGEIRYVHELAQSERDEQGLAQRLCGTVQDITDHMASERALRVARDEAERANRAKSEFLSSMSHELRTPLNAILGFGQLMEYDDTLPEEHQDSVQEILRAGRHLLELINDVLDLAKIESGRIDMSIEEVDVAALADECLTQLSAVAQNASVRLIQAIGVGVRVLADRSRLRQALLNLLSNAIKYNRRGGSVSIEAQAQGPQTLRIVVRDTGIGIPADRINELFQPFHRLHTDLENIEGTGIGLTITRRVVELMDGSVGADSEVGVGSRFWIELPVPIGTEGVDGTRAADDAPAASATPEAPVHTVLYIEDNPANIKLMQQILLKRPGIKLYTAHLPGLGLELAATHKPDLILLDINMPYMDGYQVLGILKNHPSLSLTPVVALTSNAMPRDMERGLAAGFTDYLTKPLDVPYLMGALDRLLPPRAGAPLTPLPQSHRTQPQEDA